MQGYSKKFAAVYNKQWNSFSDWAGPYIINFLEKNLTVLKNNRILDVCCGTGNLAHHLLEAGFEVTGIDLSSHMIRHARENNRPFVKQKRAFFHVKDAVSFSFGYKSGAVISTYDSFNHLNDLAALASCIGCCYKSLLKKGILLFDLNTRKGLQKWNDIHYEEGEEITMIYRGVFDQSIGRAYTRVTGFIKKEKKVKKEPAKGKKGSKKSDDLYYKFAETVYNTAFDLSQVEGLLLGAGFSSVYFTSICNLDRPIENPEEEDRVFIVARK